MNAATQEVMDEKAKKILVKAFWGSGGWKDGTVSDEDFAFAKQHGLMFDPLTIKHDALVRRTIKARDAITLKDCGTAFVCSLSTRRLDWRSALGSYGNCESMKAHRFNPHDLDSMSYLCKSCASTKSKKNECLNTMSFERIKWGGVRHDKLLYNMLDLEQFAKERPRKPVADDVKIFKKLVKAIKTSSPQDSKGKLKKRIKPLIATNTDELGTLVDILVYARVIASDSRGDQEYDAKRAKAVFGKWL